MAVRIPIPLISSTLIFLEGPTDVVLENPLDFSNDGATSSFKVFDPTKDEFISSDEASGQTTLSVTNANLFQIGDLVEITVNDGTIESTIVNGVDPAAGTIVVNDALTLAADQGNQIRVILGTSIPMTEFGVPVLNGFDYGFVGTLLPVAHPGFKLNLELDVEILFDGGSAGLVLLRTVCYVVKRDRDCQDE